MTDLFIGCPVSNREWVIEKYLEHAMDACVKADLEPSFIFVAGTDDPTIDVADTYCYGRNIEMFVIPVEESRKKDVRDWNHDRYHRMVELRNSLLVAVRQLRPKLFLSLDSDILLHPDSIVNMIESLDQFEAVGGKTYMTTNDRSHPSFGIITDNGSAFRRYDHNGVIRVDIIMAIKLMTRYAYNIDYKWDHCGEDLGWSENARKAGLILGWDGRVGNKHIMNVESLDKYDKRVGF